MKHYFVVAAIIIDNSKILCTQRKASKHEYISFKYEFPGGKVEEGESPQEALKREIKEELDLNIEVGDEYLTVNHAYPHFSLTMQSFICRADNTQPQLKEHKDFKWLENKELDSLDWAAADIPIVESLMSKKNGQF